MNKINKAFDKKANIAYIVAGYPSLENTKEILLGLDNSKIDILEIGIPYSDPISDGKSIEKAAHSALASQITADSIFDLLDTLNGSIDKPLVFLVYYNIIFSYGIKNFIQRAKKSGISGFIVPDLPYEEQDELVKELNKTDISLIPLISLTSGKRIEKIAKTATSFIYAVGSIGITGTKAANLQELNNLVKEIKAYTDKPVAIGFGIKTNEDIKNIKSICDGAIVGTRVVEICEQHPINSIKSINALFE